MEELWFVVSPQNPFKNKKSLLKDHNRLDMVQLAIKNYPKMRASNIEFSLPVPSYTIDTLAYLKEKYPDFSFSIIMGEDNLKSLHKWKNYELLLEKYQIIVYPRISDEEKKDEIFESLRQTILQHENIHQINAPIIELSATEIRNMIKAGKNTRPMLPPEVFEYLDGSSFYK